MVVGRVQRSGGRWWRGGVLLLMACVAALWPMVTCAATPSIPSTPPGNFAFRATTSTDGMIVVHTYERPLGFAAQLIAFAQADLQHPIADTLGFTLRRPVDIYIYNSRRDFLVDAQPGNAAETGAFAVPMRNAIYLPVESAVAADAQDYLPHELTHIVFHQNEDVGIYGGTIFPHWLDEGNAAYDQLADSAEVQQYAGALLAAVRRHALLDFLTSFNATYPANSDANFLAYAEARSFVGYLISTYGATAYHHFLHAAHDGDLILAATTAFGADPRRLQSRWRVSLGEQATVPATGYAPAVAPATPFIRGATPAIASTTRPFMLEQSNVMMNLIAGALLWLLVELAMLAVVEVILRATQPPGSAVQRPLRLRWEHVGVALLVPGVLLVGIAWARYGPDRSWGHASFIAGLAAFALLTIMLACNWGAILRQRISTARLTGIVTTAALVALACVQARPLAWQQSRAYAQRGAYALAVQSGQEAGASPTVLAQMHMAWGTTAQSAGDWRSATEQLHAALALMPPTDALAVALRARLSAVTLAWGQELVAAHDYATAIQVDASQQGSPDCDGACQTLLRDSQSQTYLAWGDALLLAGDTSDALAKYQVVVRQFSASPAAGAARLALREIPAAQALTSALALGARGETRAMNAKLHTLLRHAATTAAASEAAEMPQPVHGRAVNRSGATTTGQRIYFMAFALKTDARGYHYDRVLFTIATTLGTHGAFTAQLPAGYWYAVFWEDPTRPQSFNAPPGGTGIFFVRSFTPLTLGRFTGV